MSEVPGLRIERFVFSGLRQWQYRFAEGVPLTAEEVHAVRVFCKQLRGLLGLYRGVAPRRSVGKLRAVVRQLAAGFSGLRDREVQQKLFQTYAESLLSEAETVQAQALLFTDANGHDRQDLTLSQAGSMLNEIESRWKKKIPPLDGEQILKALQVSRNKEYRCFRRLRTEDDFHLWRKWVKYSYYQLELLLECPNESQARQLKGLRKTGKLLGDFHDLCLLDVHCQQGLWRLKKPKRYRSNLPVDVPLLPDEAQVLRGKLKQLLQQVRQDGQQLAVKCVRQGKALYKLGRDVS